MMQDIFLQSQLCYVLYHCRVVHMLLSCKAVCPCLTLASTFMSHGSDMCADFDNACFHLGLAVPL